MAIYKMHRLSSKPFHSLIPIYVILMLSTLKQHSAPPVPVYSLYDRFLEFSVSQNCHMPSFIPFPYDNPPEENNEWDILLKPLGICHEAVAKDNKSVLFTLCGEVFNVLANITCYVLPQDVKMPNMKAKLSSNVCSDFNVKKSLLSHEAEFFGTRLADEFMCNLACGGRNEDACKFLLWAYEIQSQFYDALEKVNTKNNKDKKLKGTLPGEQQTDQSEDVTTETKNAEEKVNVPEHGVKLSDNAEVTQTPKDIPDQQNSITIAEINLKPAEEVAKKESNQENNLLFDNAKATKKVDFQSKTGGKISIVDDENKAHDENKFSSDMSTQLDGNEKHENVHAHAGTTLQQKVSLKDNAVDVKNKINAEDLKKASKAPDVKNKPLENTEVGEPKESTNIGETVSSKAKENAAVDDTKNAQNIEDMNENSHENTISTSNQDRPSEEAGDMTFSDASKAVAESTNVAGEATDKEAKKASVVPDTTVSVPLEQMEGGSDLEQPVDREQYNGSLEKPVKNKQPDLKYTSRVDEIPFIEGMKKTSIDEFPQRNFYPPGSSGGQEVITMNQGAFPTEDDGHFFLYFVSMILILMAGYVLFHNKQKIIALIVEGRHEKRRRHGPGYKKLETK